MYFDFVLNMNKGDVFISINNQIYVLKMKLIEGGGESDTMK